MDDGMMEHLKLQFDFKNSMLYWYPLVKTIVPTPETYLVVTDPEDVSGWLDDGIAHHVIKHLRSSAKAIGYPLFMRTDTFSAKHEYLETCYVPDEKALARHIMMILDMNGMTGIISTPVRAIAIRKFIEPKFRFRAFTDLPIGYELRVFIRDGVIQCYHYYWPKGSIRFRGDQRLNPPESWQKDLDEMKKHSEGYGMQDVRGYALAIAQFVEGYWSVDFMMDKAGKWWMIDMALGDASYHAPCEYQPEDQRKQYNENKVEEDREDILGLLALLDGDMDE